MKIIPVEIREKQGRRFHTDTSILCKQQKRIVRTLASLPARSEERHEELQKKKEKDKIFMMQKPIKLKTESRRHS